MRRSGRSWPGLRSPTVLWPTPPTENDHDHPSAYGRGGPAGARGGAVGRASGLLRCGGQRHRRRTTMTTRQPMPDGAVLVAIDVAKHRNEILIEAPASLRRRRLTILNAREEHDRLVGALTGYEPPVVVGF